MMPRAALRRFTIAVVALAGAGLLFRAPIASALVTRGDELLAGGRPERAVSAYRRALALYPASAVAADRLAFWLLRDRTRGAATRAFAIADRALGAGARSAALYADRGLAAARLGRWARAERDLRRAAADGRDPRYAHLAARMAQRAGQPARMRDDLRLALALDPRYAPARVLLASGR